VPPERGLALARQYGCDNDVRLIIDFIPNERSPPPAPKHVNTPSSKTAAKREAAASNSLITTRSSGRKVAGRAGAISPSPGSDDGSMTDAPSGSSASSRTPSPIRESHLPGAPGENGEGSKKRKRREDEGAPQPKGRDARSHSDQILEYFISDSSQIPKFLLSPPTDFDANAPIDDDNHTPLHWASAMGRLKVVKLLISAGADVFRVNKSGQTPLMRSVMFANNYDVRKFPELYETLHRSTLNIDNMNRTVFHHIIDVAMSKGKTHAARYYMETILHRLSEYPTELADIINFQDEEGETALTLAARCRSKRLVKLLIDHGADPKITNHDGKSAEDYILEDERFRFSPTLPNRTIPASQRNGFPGLSAMSSMAWNMMDRPALHHSVIAQRTSTKVVNEVAKMLDNLATSFDRELLEKERDLNQAHALLNNIDSELAESQRSVQNLKSQAATAAEAEEQLQKLQESLSNKLAKRHRLGWEKWSKDEDFRDRELYDEEGKMIGEPTEQTQDIVDLHNNIPEGPPLHVACESIRVEIAKLREQRTELFKSFVSQQAEAGTGGKMNEYRRLIAAGCGGMNLPEVEDAIDSLYEVRHFKLNTTFIYRICRHWKVKKPTHPHLGLVLVRLPLVTPQVLQVITCRSM
jgi:transcription factor MBP1